MSGPLASLNKVRKTPFRQPTAMSARSDNFPELNSYRESDSNDNVDMLMDEVATSMARKSFLEGRQPSKVERRTSNDDFMSSLINRVETLEADNSRLREELRDKTRRVRVLEEKVEIQKRMREVHESVAMQEAENKCLLLQKKVDEMEQFLADYGLVWVGEDGVWHPDDSLVPEEEFHVDYDLVAKNVAELNELSGVNDMQMVQHKPGMVVMQRPQPVPLTLYANGMILYQGPFRPFTDSSTRQCIQDIMDGYFPSELQTRYPDGVPIVLTDFREVTFKYKDAAHSEVFSGTGELLGQRKGSLKGSASIHSRDRRGDRGASAIPDNGSSPNLTTSELPFPPVRVDDFLRHLPKQVVAKSGNLVPVRDAIQQQLLTGGNGTERKVSRLIPLKFDLADDRTGDPPKLAAIRIRSEDGQEMYSVQVPVTTSLATLIACLDKQRPPNLRGTYDVFTAYPAMRLTDWKLSLDALELCPSAVLNLRAKSKK